MSSIRIVIRFTKESFESKKHALEFEKLAETLKCLSGFGRVCKGIRTKELEEARTICEHWSAYFWTNFSKGKEKLF